MSKVTLFSTSVDVNTGEVKRHRDELDEWYGSYVSAEEAYKAGEMMGAAGYATFNDDGFENVYAESLVSQEDADRLVWEFAEALADKLSRAARKVRGE